jgi:BirA family transcriptional regulator, biotin operon repressor / biotin---[acetyl-CoA-carboxylase] ligase
MIVAELLSVEAIRQRLRTAVVGQHLYLFGEVDSTNTVLRALARAGAADGTVVLADGQRQGRGRLGQEWFSPSGVNLYASVLLRDRVRPREAGLISLLAGLALADTVKELGIHPAIKWPNDILVGRKKIGGSLMECACRGEAVDFLVLGVGVNLNVDPDSLRAALGDAATAATSLSTVTGYEIDRNAFAASYLNHLEDWALRRRIDGAAPVLSAWRDLDILTGRRVMVRGVGNGFDGRVLGVNDEGQLVVQDSLGRGHLVLAEEIRVLD